MEIPAWKARLIEAIEKDGRDDAVISRAAGLGRNFVNQFRGTRVPSVENLLALCAEVDVSLSRVFFGSDISREAEEMLTLFSRLDPEAQAHFLGLLRAMKQAA